MISIIIPTYNEAGNISRLIKQICAGLKGNKFEIIVVDDDSPDGTWRQVEKIGVKDKRIRLVRRVNERGLTSAFNRGIKESRGDIIGWLDADLSHPPSLLPMMLSKLLKFDVAVASRYVAGGGDNRQEKVSVILSRLINYLAEILLNRDFHDYTSGYILIKKRLLKNYSLVGDYGEYFINLINYLQKSGANIKEVGYVNISRTEGVSKTTANWRVLLGRGVKYLRVLFQLWLKK